MTTLQIIGATIFLALQWAWENPGLIALWFCGWMLASCVSNISKACAIYVKKNS